MKIIARISNGIGNQMFLYASAFSIAKKLNRVLELDISSGIESMIKKNKSRKFKNFHLKYELDIFNISSSITSKENTFNNFYKYFLRKILLIEDKFRIKKNFILEHEDKDKNTYFINNFDNSELKDKVYIEGYFESEKYFNDYRKEIIKEFTLKKKIDCCAPFENKINNTESVSICIRANRFNETERDDLDKSNIFMSQEFEKQQYQYILRGIEYINTKIINPQFYLFSDDINKISHLFDSVKNVTLINKFKNNKIHEDYFLMSKCKHHIVSPTTFHFWPAWLSEYENKICTKPINLNSSKNFDYWPLKWVGL